VQELLDMFPDSDEADESGPSSPIAPQIMMHLSIAAAVGKASPKTFSLIGEMQGRSLSILVDSRSSHTFLSLHMAAALSSVQTLDPAVRV
jgi:hypothetical protein